MIKILGTADPHQEFPPTAFFEVGLPAGFPSPAEDYVEQGLNLHQLLIEHPAATFFIRVEGESMVDAHIHSGDILIVDRSLNAQNGKIVVALLNGAFTVKRLKIQEKKIFLCPENTCYQPIEVTSESEFKIWGVVTYVIHRAR